MLPQRPYAKDEDEMILAFIQHRKHQVNGNSIWKEAEELQVTIYCNLHNSNPP